MSQHSLRPAAQSAVKLKSTPSSVPIGSRLSAQKRPTLLTPTSRSATVRETQQVQRRECSEAPQEEDSDNFGTEEPKVDDTKMVRRPMPPKSLPSFTEAECDASPDERLKIDGLVGFNSGSTTLNLLSVNDGQLLTSVSDAGFQHLLAGARANVGLLAGRYAFEVACVEHRVWENLAEPPVRIGFSTASCSLFLGGDANENSVCFDFEGYFIGGGQRKRLMKALEFGEVACVLLNLKSDGPNAHTISLFRNGVRACDPQPIPESLRGQPLFPAVSFRGAMIRVNFSEAPMRPLKFSYTCLQEVAVDDCVFTPADNSLEDRTEVIFPVALPNEGFHDWVEFFLEEHKDYIEFSSRAQGDWINRSDVGESNLASVSSLQMTELVALSRRPCVVAEMRNNLTVDGRKTGLEKFAAPGFKKVAVVVVGEPPEIIKQRAAAANTDTSGAGENVWFRKRDTPDMPPQELALTFTDFTLPEMAEGFDEVRYEWLPAENAQEHLKDWMKRCKLTSRIEDLKPSKWFQNKWSAWQKAYKEWEKKQSEWKSIMETLSEWKKEGGDSNQDEAATSTDPYNLEVFKVKDVNDIGEGEPLFANFEYEDWCLMSLRFELHLLCHAFTRDVDDPQRPSFLEKNLAFYYELYYKKAFVLDVFNMASLSELINLIPDSVKLCPETSLVKPLLEESKALEYFLRKTEDCRRIRLRRTDAGDETAILKFSKPGSAAAKSAKQAKPSEQAKAVKPSEASRPKLINSKDVRPASNSRPTYTGRGQPPTLLARSQALASGRERNGERGQPQARHHGSAAPALGGGAKRHSADARNAPPAKQARMSPSIGSSGSHSYGGSHHGSAAGVRARYH